MIWYDEPSFITTTVNFDTILIHFAGSLFVHYDTSNMQCKAKFGKQALNIRHGKRRRCTDTVCGNCWGLRIILAETPYLLWSEAKRLKITALFFLISNNILIDLQLGPLFAEFCNSPKVRLWKDSNFVHAHKERAQESGGGSIA